MSRTVIWLPEAMAAYRRLRSSDPDGAKLMASVVASLAADPRPAHSNALGQQTSGGYVWTAIASSMR